MDKFIDRMDAGLVLADCLKEYAHQKDTIIIALPRGGVPIAYEIACALSLPLDILIVRKLGVPGHEELAMGAIASFGTIIFNDALIKQLHLSQTAINQVLQAEQIELARREKLYRGNLPFPDLQAKTIILVDDGIATGFTIRAAVIALQKHKPAAIIIAVPVAALATCEELKTLVDKLVCPLQPIYFNAVGMWYEDFSATTDSEVIELMQRSKSGIC